MNWLTTTLLISIDQITEKNIVLSPTDSTQEFKKAFAKSNQDPRICQNAKFHAKSKIPYLGTFRVKFKKTIIILQINALKFVKTQNLDHLGIFEIQLNHLPRIFQNAKFCGKTKICRFWAKHV